MERFRHVFRAMASAAEVQVYASDAAEAGRAFAAIQREVERIEAKYSRYRADSVVTAINRAAGGEPVMVDAETASLLDYADTCWRQSGGLFDITSGVLRTVWDFKNGVAPDSQQLGEMLGRIGWGRVQRGPQTIALDAGMEIDFGGIGKEYAADRAMGVAADVGVRYGLVNLGGDIRVIGPHAAGGPWRIGIEHPRVPRSTIAHLELSAGGLATSGDYERYFERDGKRYCHTLNPKTGWPVEDGPQSVSVVAPLCTIAGSCATIAMLKGDGAEAWLCDQGFAYLVIDRLGEIHRGEIKGA
jgi:thiamine biosynthesis lipoprotein